MLTINYSYLKCSTGNTYTLNIVLTLTLSFRPTAQFGFIEQLNKVLSDLGRGKVDSNIYACHKLCTFEALQFIITYSSLSVLFVLSEINLININTRSVKQMQSTKQQSSILYLNKSLRCRLEYCNLHLKDSEAE